MEQKIKSFTSEIVKSNINADEMTIVHYISTNAVDRYNEVLVPDGIDQTNYRNNPIVLFGHNSNSLPIGKNLWLKVDESHKGVLAKTQFDKKSEVASEIFRLYAEGFLNSWSVGFLPKTDYQRIGDIYQLSAWELLEYSAVPIPANPEALSFDLGEVKNDIIKKAIRMTDEYKENTIDKLLNEIDNLKRENLKLSGNFILLENKLNSIEEIILKDREKFINNFEAINKFIGDVSVLIKRGDIR